MKKTKTYDIITVRWKEDQYKVWRHWVDKTCPTASVHWIPDTKPFPWCWSGGKVPCLDYGFETNRVIYMDTDTIVTHDLEPVFEIMGNFRVGVSYGLPKDKMQSRYAKQIELVRNVAPYKFRPKSVSSGMIVTTEPSILHEAWSGMMGFPLIKQLFNKDHLYDEHVLSLAISWLYEKAEVWDMPLELHGNIISRKYFGDCETPWVIHYHKPERLEKKGLEKWLLLD